MANVPSTTIMSPPTSPGRPWKPAPAPITVVARNETVTSVVSAALNNLTPDATPCPTPIHSPKIGAKSTSTPILTATATPSPTVFAISAGTPIAICQNTESSETVFKFPLPPPPVQETTRSQLASGETEKSRNNLRPTPLLVVNSPSEAATTDGISLELDNKSDSGKVNRSKSPAGSDMSQEDSELLSIFAMASSTSGALSLTGCVSSGHSSGPSSNAGDSDSELMSADGTNPRYKTEVCRNYKEGSKCVYGDQCQFAHGRRELREVVRNSKYKTKACQKYWQTGYCAYGPRCNFLHNDGPSMEDEQYNKRKLRNSIGSSGPYLPCQPVTRSHSENGSFCSGRTTPTSVMMSKPPPPLTMPRLTHNTPLLNMSGALTPTFNVLPPAPADVFTDVGRWDNQHASQVSPQMSPPTTQVPASSKDNTNAAAASETEP